MIICDIKLLWAIKNILRILRFYCMYAYANTRNAKDLFPATQSVNTKHSPNVGTMLAHRLRRRPNIVPTLCERLVFAGH